MEDRIFETEIKADKNSNKFDMSLLEELKTLSDVPVKEFDKTIKKIMRKKSTCKLWQDNKLTNEWDGKMYRKTNYRCCPSSRRARSIFCLVLDIKEGGITVIDGFLSAV